MAENETRWYAVERRYVVHEFAYVAATSAAAAKARVQDGDFYDSGDPVVERYFKPRQTHEVTYAEVVAQTSTEAPHA